ncbi:hypothetical protein [Sporocytophaga myxococcoides]|uniref:hypothetical protein n=1 Tax=Sporocytophaga myxococcoides TaxID=153721 RepID=UPI0003FA664F|nr:hypothetical protein [Sporocytophaga myxococcoides]
MMKKSKVFFLGLLALVVACKQNDQEGILPKSDPESEAKKAATFSVQNLDQHHFLVSLTNINALDHTFKYSNGESSKSVIDTVYFPFKGSYEITLEVLTANGTSSSSKKVKVNKDDASNPDLNDPIVKLLTGGLQDIDGKTWVVSAAPFQSGMGPFNTLTPDWYNFPEGLIGFAWENGILQNSFTFNLRNYQYTPKNTSVTVHYAYANRYFGTSQPMYGDIALSDPDHVQAPFTVKNAHTGIGTGYTIDIANNSYIGYCEKRNHYEIVSITNDTLRIRNPYSDDAYTDPSNDVGVRYFTLVAKH